MHVEWNLAMLFLWKWCFLAIKTLLVVFSIILISFAWYWFQPKFQPRLKNVEYSITKNKDGGYSINIVGDFRQEYSYVKTQFQIQLEGEGTDWSYRAQNGLYYSFDEIKVNGLSHGDEGYAWVNQDKTYVFLNLYWIQSPDDLRPSDLNGKYAILPQPTK